MTQGNALPRWAKIAIGITVVAAAALFIFDRIVNEVTHQELSNRARENSPEEIKKREQSAHYHQTLRTCMRANHSIPRGMTEQQFCEMYAGTQVLCKENRQRGGICE